MAHISADRVRQLSTTSGTGNITLASSVASYRAFSSVLSVSDTFYYTIAHLVSDEWEVGIGTYVSLNAFSRNTIISSSNSGSAVNFSAGDKDVFITAPSSKFLQVNNVGNLIPADLGAITLGTDTTGNYVGSVATTAPLAGGAAGSEGGVLTLSLATAYGDTQNPYASKTANFVLAAPSGAAGVPTFRAVTVADIPTLNQNTTGSAATWTTGRTISLTGDVTGTSGTFDGSGNLTIATTNTNNTFSRPFLLMGA